MPTAPQGPAFFSYVFSINVPIVGGPGGTVVRVCVCARCFVWLSPSHACHHRGLLQEYLTAFRRLGLFISMSANWMLWFIGRKQSCYPAECVWEEKPGKRSCHRKWPRVEKRIIFCYWTDPSSSPETANLGFGGVHWFWWAFKWGCGCYNPRFMCVRVWLVCCCLH